MGFSINAAGTVGYHMGKKIPFLTAHTKIISRHKCERQHFKPLDSNIGEYLYDPKGKEF